MFLSSEHHNYGMVKEALTRSQSQELVERIYSSDTGRFQYFATDPTLREHPKSHRGVRNWHSRRTVSLKHGEMLTIGLDDKGQVTDEKTGDVAEPAFRVRRADTTYEVKPIGPRGSQGLQAYRKGLPRFQKGTLKNDRFEIDRNEWFTALTEDQVFNNISMWGYEVRDDMSELTKLGFGASEETGVQKQPFQIQLGYAMKPRSIEQLSNWAYKGSEWILGTDDPAVRHEYQGPDLNEASRTEWVVPEGSPLAGKPHPAYK